MKPQEVIEQLRKINQEKMLASFHDDSFFRNFPDVDALDTAIILINFLANQKPSDKLTVAEIFEAADIEF